MIQKIIKVGNSYAVTIPKSVVEAYDIDQEEFVNLHEDPKKKRLVISFVNDEDAEEIVNPEVYKIAKNLLKRYLPAFKELAKK